MGGILFLLIIIILIAIIWALPLYVFGNLVLWLFGLSFRITLIQALGVCLLLSTVRNMLFKKED